MQQHHGKAAPAFEIMRAHPQGIDEFALYPAHMTPACSRVIRMPGTIFGAPATSV